MKNLMWGEKEIPAEKISINDALRLMELFNNNGYKAYFQSRKGNTVLKVSS